MNCEIAHNNIELTIISGDNYRFEIATGTKGRERIFYIRAYDNRTGRFSSINNLNTILSELEIDVDNPRYYDSLWEVKESEISCLKNKTITLLSDPMFRRFLEYKLDEDQDCEEWENKTNQ